MKNDILLPLLNNAVLLLAMATAYDLLTARTPGKKNSRARQILTGIALGLLGIGLILAAVPLYPGIVFDTRSILLSVSGLFFGLLPTGIAVAMTAVFRLLQGGAAAGPGVAVIVATGGIGLLWRCLRKNPLEQVRAKELYLFGLLTHMVMLALMFILPLPIALNVLAQISWPVLIIYPLGTVALGLLLAGRLRRERTAAALTESEKNYRCLFHNKHTAMLLLSPEDGAVIDANPAACRFYGWPQERIRRMNISQINTIPLEEFQEKLEKAQDAEFHELLVQHRLADGSLRDVEVLCSPVTLGEQKLLYSIIHDTTERNREETGLKKLLAEADQSRRALLSVVEDLKQTESKLQLAQFALDHSADPAFWINPDGTFAYVNQSASRSLGYLQDELLRLAVQDIDPDFPAEHWSQHWQELKQAPLVFETRHRTKDGRIFPVEVHTTFMEFEGKEYNFAFVHNITNRKQAEALLIQNKQKVEGILQAAPVGIGLIVNRAMIEINDMLCRMLGYTQDELLGQSARILYPTQEEFDSVGHEKYRQIAETGSGTVEARWKKKTGEILDVLLSSTPLNRENLEQGVIFTALDITERKRMQEAIEKRIVALTRPLDQTGNIAFEELFDLNEIQRIQDEFAAATGVASIIALPDGTPITQPSNFTRLCQDIIRKTAKGCSNCFKSDAALGCHHPEGPVIQPCLSSGLWDAGVSITVGDQHVANWLIGQVRDETQSDEAMRNYARSIGADEQSFMDAFYNVPVMSPEHFRQVAQALFTLSNQLSTAAYLNLQQARFIADEQRRTEELHRLSTAIEQSPDAIVITDPDGSIQYVNPAFERITGYSYQEAIGKNPRILKSGQHDELFYSSLWKTIQAGTIWAGRFVNKRKNGELYTEEASISPVRGPSGTISGYVAVKRDITEDLLREEQFRQSQKMEAVGQLAGGIAHDFNNILQAILGFSEILMIRLNKDSMEHRNVAEIQKAAKRAAEMTRQLLAFSRKQPVDKKRIDLNAVVRDTEVLLQLLLGSKVTCNFEPAPSLHEVYADHSQITQIIMNLAVNARDAMPDGGRLTLSTENITFEPQAIVSIPQAEPGSFVCLSVTDTGCGMSREAQDHLFEPFFTTKEVGQGTGLGLAVVYGIVKQNKGWIHVYSETGLGTTMKIYLPACKAAAPDQPDDSLHYGRILLVEDDTETRNLVIRILQTSGYESVAVSNAEDALQLFQKEKGLFDLLFSDMILPGKSGLELADALRAENPSLPILLYSGYQDQRERWKNLDSKGYHLLKKPFSIASLLAAVHEALTETIR